MHRVRDILQVLMLALFLGSSVFAQDEAKPPTAGLPEDFAEKDKLQRSKSAPHEEMKKRVGKWKVTTKFAAMFGGQSELGECTMRLILDGKFMVSEGTATYMGQKCSTYGVYGYDSLASEYTFYNLNSIYTLANEMRGKMRDDGIIEYKGIMKDAMTVDGRPYRAEEKGVNDDRFEIKVFDSAGDKEIEVFTMIYERIK